MIKMIFRNVLAATALLCSLAAPAQAQKTKAVLNAEITTSFPDNVLGAITPLILRNVTSDMINSIMPNAPVVTGNLACWDGTTGLLKDCAVAPSGVGLTVGTSPIAGGTTTRVLFDNAGILGEYTISGSGSVCMTASCAMTTPALGTPTAIVLTNGTGLPISTGLTGAGTGVLAALGNNLNGAAGLVGFSGALGIPTSGTLTNATGLPISTGLTGAGTGVLAALGNTLNAASGLVGFSGALGTPTSGTLTNATGLPISTGVSGLGTGVATQLGLAVSTAGGSTTTIASGTSALGTGAITSATCATVVTTAATNTLTTDVVTASFNGDPTAVTGYVPLTTGMLTIMVYPTANNVNFKVCNNTSGSVTPGAITLNWRVVR